MSAVRQAPHAWRDKADGGARATAARSTLRRDRRCGDERTRRRPPSALPSAPPPAAATQKPPPQEPATVSTGAAMEEDSHASIDAALRGACKLAWRGAPHSLRDEETPRGLHQARLAGS